MNQLDLLIGNVPEQEKELIRAGELIEIIISFGKHVVEPGKDDDEEGYHSRKPLELHVFAGKHLQVILSKLF